MRLLFLFLAGLAAVALMMTTYAGSTRSVSADRHFDCVLPVTVSAGGHSVTTPTVCVPGP